MNQHSYFRFSFFAFTFLILSSSLTAQIADRYKYIEAGMMGGLTNYSGDVAESSVEWSEMQLGYGAYVRYHFSSAFSLKLHGYSGSLSGDDANSPVLKNRSFRFSTSFTELGLVGEIHFFRKSRYSKTGVHRFQVTPYLYGGIGLVIATAEAEYYGPADQRNDHLRVPLPEDNLQHRFPLAPVGGGLRFDLFDQIIVGLEGGLRPVFSDDLDGVKINGNPKRGDWYYYGGLTASFLFAKAGKRHPY
jgi:hypothetical protein